MATDTRSDGIDVLLAWAAATCDAERDHHEGLQACDDYAATAGGALLGVERRAQLLRQVVGLHRERRDLDASIVAVVAAREWRMLAERARRLP